MRQQSILTLDAVQDVATTLCDNVEASNSCSESELKIISSSSYHTVYFNTCVYTPWGASVPLNRTVKKIQNSTSSMN